MDGARPADLRTPQGVFVRDLRFRPVTSAPTRRLTPAQVARFNADGYLFPLPVFSPAEADANRAYFDRLMGLASEEGHNQYAISGWQGRCRGIYDLCAHPRIVDLVEDILGPNVVCWGAHYFAKMPRDGMEVAWHQDAPYWPFSASRAVTAWVAIDDVGAGNAPMRYIPGSHLHGALAWRRSRPKNVLHQTVPDAERWGRPPVAVTMRAGEVSLHTDLIVHGSEANASDRRRCGVALRYFPADVRYVPGSENERKGPDGPYGMGIICRGSDPTGYWRTLRRPSGDNVPKRKGRPKL